MCKIFSGQLPETYEPITRNIRLNGQSTSIRLENAYWEIIDAIAEAEGVTTPVFLSTLQSEVLLLYGEVKNFTSLLRCACLKKIRLEGSPELIEMLDKNGTVEPKPGVHGAADRAFFTIEAK